jgi:hypothetical protein
MAANRRGQSCSLRRMRATFWATPAAQAWTVGFVAIRILFVGSQTAPLTYSTTSRRKGEGPTRCRSEKGNATAEALCRGAERCQPHEVGVAVLLR